MLDEIEAPQLGQKLLSSGASLPQYEQSIFFTLRVTMIRLLDKACQERARLQNFNITVNLWQCTLPN